MRLTVPARSPARVSAEEDPKMADHEDGDELTEKQALWSVDPIPQNAVIDKVVPGLGKASAKALAKRTKEDGAKEEINNAVQLVGLYLFLNADKDAFVAELVRSGVKERFAKVCADNVATRVDDFCSSEAPKAFAASTDGETTVAEATFNGNKLSTSELKKHQVPGVGDTAIKNLKAHGITSSAQLVGLFMLLNMHVDKFHDKLKEEYGIRLQEISKYGYGHKLLYRLKECEDSFVSTN